MTEPKKKRYATIIDEYNVVDSGLIPTMLCTGGSYLIIDELIEEASKDYERFIKEYEEPDEDGYTEYEWDRGIAP